MPEIYIILGADHSNRHEILNTLINEGLDAEEKVVIYSPQTDADTQWNSEYAKRPNSKVMNWLFANDRFHVVNVEEDEVDYIFILTDGKQNPIDQLEAIRHWLFRRRWDVTRIISVVDCKLAHQYPPLIEWFRAIIYFSDYVLLNNREGIPQKWINEFIEYFKKECYPAIFEYVKKGFKLHNPVGVLDTEIRRMSLAFDPDDAILFEIEPKDASEYETIAKEPEIASAINEELPFEVIDLSQYDGNEDEIVEVTGIEDEDIDDDADDEDIDEDEFEEELTDMLTEEELENLPEEPFFEKNTSGVRKIKLPDIREFLT